jgi:hypothetical protein
LLRCTHIPLRFLIWGWQVEMLERRGRDMADMQTARKAKMEAPSRPP